MNINRDLIVVTGLGAITPLGGDVSSTWSAMLAGKSGVHQLTESWASEVPVRIAAPVAADPATILQPPQLRHMDRCEQLALIAAREAWQDAGAPQVEPERLGVSVSSGVGGLGSMLDDYDALREKGWRRVSPFMVPKLMVNGAAAWIGIELGARAGAHTTVSACASGAEAIGHGIQMIRSGQADIVIAGGTDAPILPLIIAAFAVIRALSERNDEPERASRPFDKSRDGFVLGEGAGMVVLESAGQAIRRGAVVHAVVAGVGYSADSYHITRVEPDGAGLALAIRRALADARAAPEQVGHINAHATSTPAGDRAEAEAIRRTLGADTGGAVVSATKSMTGHLLGATGAIESIAAICALRDGIAPPTINLEDLGEEVTTAGLQVGAEPRELRNEPGLVVLNNSLGFGGHNVALAFTAL